MQGKSRICAAIIIAINCSAIILQRTFTKMRDVVPGSGCRIGHSEEGGAVSYFLFLLAF